MMTREEWLSILEKAKKISKKDYPYEISVFNGCVPINNKIHNYLMQ